MERRRARAAALSSPTKPQSSATAAATGASALPSVSDRSNRSSLNRKPPRDGLYAAEVLAIVACSLVALFMIFQQQMAPEARFQAPVFLSTWPLGSAYDSNVGEEASVLPVVSDVDGDGFVDVVFINPETNELTVASTHSGISNDDGSAAGKSKVGGGGRLLVRYSGDIVPQGATSATGYSVVALSTGFIDSANVSSSDRYESFNRDKDASVESRHQVIVVVTNAWRILCFDHQARLLWENRVMEGKGRALLPGLVLSEVAVAVTSVPLRVGDRGSIVVGGKLSNSASLEGRDTTASVAGGGHEHGRQGSEDDEHRGDGFADERTEAEYVSTEMTQQHVNFVAFDAGTGKLRWQHENNDYRPWDSDSDASDADDDTNDADDSMPNSHADVAQNEFREPNVGDDQTERNAETPRPFGAHPQLDYANMYMPRHAFQRHVVSAVGRHKGELDWREFHDDVIRQLPHSWHRRSDTSIVPQHFARRDTEQRSSPPANFQHQAVSTHVNEYLARQCTSRFCRMRFGSLLLSSLPLFGSQATLNGLLNTVPHDEQEHVQKPNVVVVHHRRGLEVVHMFTGRTLCQVPLGADSHDESSVRVYADINDDGIIEEIVVRGGGTVEHEEVCEIRCVSGLPATDELFRRDICDRAKFERSQLARFMLGGDTRGKVSFSNMRVAPPLVVDSALTHRALFNARNIIAPTLAALSYGAGRRDAESTARLVSEAVSAIPRIHRTKDVLIFLSSGRFLSIRADGKINWETSTDAVWGADAQSLKHHSIDEDLFVKWRRRASGGGGAGGKWERRVVPSLVPFHLVSEHAPGTSAETIVFRSLDLEPDPSYVLLAGARLELVDIRTGRRVVRTFELPRGALPSSRPVVADWNNDGLNDVLLLTARGIVGVAQEPSAQPFGILLPVFGLVAFSLIGGLVALQLPRRWT